MGDIDKLTRSRLNRLDKRVRSIEAKLNIIQILILAAHDVKPWKIARKLEIDGSTVLHHRQATGGLLEKDGETSAG